MLTIVEFLKTSSIITFCVLTLDYLIYLGCSRALLCKTDSTGVLRVTQLSVDHDLNNQEELHRLQQLGVDTDKLLQIGHIANHQYTRTVGNYNLKTGYRDMEALRYEAIAMYNIRAL